MAKLNKLTIGTLKNAVDKKFTQRKVTVLIDKKEYSFFVDEHVDPLKLDAMAQELMEKSVYIKEHNYELSDKNYFQFLICKYLTNVEVCNTAIDFGIQIQILTYFMQLGILEKIIEVVNVDEINELMPQAINNAVEKFTSDEMKKQIENDPSLLRNILGDKNKGLIDILEKTKELKDLETQKAEEDINKEKQTEL